MANADALQRRSTERLHRPTGSNRPALLALFGVAAALQFSIAIAQSLLAVAVVCWLALVIVRRERIDVPRFFWPLLALRRR